ncbi:immunoglobulin-like domain-containing protein [Flavobacterium gawalongense]|uniref:Atrophied bacterial Ig domain-containing protein n=1 Tax=Flavobacterium gawalongense TaxID=2594432 RepID=A0A553BMM3_9FLAO|nr:immunoglobulin-like domain-containing protein [Flavobacterium gawalongense]TRX01871.1 hypothetical protein FNW33_08205 [Flavobacterium gawalongense]TRX06325.1 hypothetical protein FNW12_08740 [Flavobacterium gawalongense]TRX09499.1 hypothetical protein FNW11_09340 [Flavobacterium gawalongense]TRX10666.1 hypothetical protein FNW10_09145 [Flavobacterium gawalongense]TRX27882.1 hypothetical protein FNW38_09020 [Flavobacterium gawalongense]
MTNIKLSFSFFLGIILLISTAVIALPHQEKTVLADQDKVASDAKSLNIPKGYSKNLQWNLLLDSVGTNGSSISWKSGKPKYISIDGKLLK